MKGWDFKQSGRLTCWLVSYLITNNNIQKVNSVMQNLGLVLDNSTFAEFFNKAERAFLFGGFGFRGNEFKINKCGFLLIHSFPAGINSSELRDSTASFTVQATVRCLCEQKSQAPTVQKEQCTQSS
jgi:hypothetical protein